MAKPRRAVRRRVSGRVLLSSALIGVTAVATLAVWQMTDTEASVALPAAGESAVIDDAPDSSATDPSATDPAIADPTPSVSTSPAAAATPTASPSVASVDWAAVVDGCRKRVSSRDTVIARASTGIDHWSQHVQAQTDANAGRISIDAMKKSFMRTRLLGPSDVAGYRGALDLAAGQSGSCGTPKGAPAKVAATLAGCSARAAAQKPVLVAGSRGMHDWESHLAAMRRNKMHHVDNAQQIWIAAWRAAPDDIKSFDRASAKFGSAAAC